MDLYQPYFEVLGSMKQWYEAELGSLIGIPPNTTNPYVP